MDHGVRFSGTNFFQNLRTRYEIRHTILNIKLVFRRLEDDRMVVSESAQTSLSNVMLLAGNYDIILYLLWTVCPCFMRNEQMRRGAPKKRITGSILRHDFSVVF